MEELEAREGHSQPARWPGVVGVIGIIVAIFMFVDKIDDLFVSIAISPEAWTRMIGPDYAELVDQLMPPMAWLVPAALVGGALAVLLFVGSLRLRRRLGSGIDFCRKWAQLAIAWAVVEMVFAFWWLPSTAEVVTEYSGQDAHSASAFAVFGILVALAVLLAFPVFLLIWFSRPEVRAEYAGWPQE